MLIQAFQHSCSAGGQLAVPEETREEVLGSDEVSEQVGLCLTEHAEIVAQLSLPQSLSSDVSQ